MNEVANLAKKDGVLVRGYVSCVVGCPYEGPVDPIRVAPVSDPSVRTINVVTLQLMKS